MIGIFPVFKDDDMLIIDVDKLPQSLIRRMCNSSSYEQAKRLDIQNERDFDKNSRDFRNTICFSCLVCPGYIANSCIGRGNAIEITEELEPYIYYRHSKKNYSMPTDYKE